ncbi:MAG: hypothetical protein JSV56_11025 [Methanomassiliicoccales archaeon]|nr:MAG: hypothetical protein JSV56_11025 [Methanomassiliicoccales archaeon]
MPKRYWDDKEWARKHYTDLIKKYHGKWVAIVNKKVVASGKNLSRVEKIARLKTKLKHIPVCYVEGGAIIY